MVEVPEHLLRRSRERREALGLAPGGESAPAPSEEEEAAPAEEGEAAPAPAAARAPAPAPGRPAPPEPPPPPPPPPPYVEAATRRKKVPVWVAPVLLALPVWAWIYAGVLAAPEGPSDPVLALGEEVYTTTAGCAACHGAQGQGGVGPAFTAGEVLQTFPDREAHIEWVRQGSDGVGIGNPYGDPDRPGGGRTVEGGMPGFADLSDEELLAVVRYEREVLGGEESAEAAEGEGGEGGGEEGGEAGGGGEEAGE